MMRPPPVSPEGCYRSGAWIADLGWPDVGPRLRAGAVVIVPMGAAAKVRGAHLPVDTDRETAIEQKMNETNCGSGRSFTKEIAIHAKPG
jgi:hypothetical protein